MNLESVVPFRCHFIDGRGLIETIGEIDRDADDFYIPRQAMQELFDGFRNLSTTNESIWTKLVRIFVRFGKFLWDIFIFLVSSSASPASPQRFKVCCALFSCAQTYAMTTLLLAMTVQLPSIPPWFCQLHQFALSGLYECDSVPSSNPSPTFQGKWATVEDVLCLGWQEWWINILEMSKARKVAPQWAGKRSEPSQFS